MKKKLKMWILPLKDKHALNGHLPFTAIFHWQICWLLKTSSTLFTVKCNDQNALFIAHLLHIHVMVKDYKVDLQVTLYCTPPWLRNTTSLRPKSIKSKEGKVCKWSTSLNTFGPHNPNFMVLTGSSIRPKRYFWNALYIYNPSRRISLTFYP